MNEAPDTPEMKAVAAFLAASFDSKMSGANMREAMIWSLGCAALAAQPGAVALTDEQIKRHSLLAADCPGASTVILVSSLRRLLSAAPTEAKPAQQDAVDAERYRYLRDFYSPPSDEPWDNMDCALAHGGEELDALIDAAISAKKGGAV